MSETTIAVNLPVADGATPADNRISGNTAIAFSIAFKGPMVANRFMELQNANRHLRATMRICFCVIPSMVVFVFLFPGRLARMTALQ